jgi:hypothetical protein
MVVVKTPKETAMSEGSFSETTGINFFQRMGKALIGALVGVVLFFVSFIVLFWNEGRAVDTAAALKEAGGAVVSISSDKVDPANNDKLVHMSGEATTDEILSDDLFPPTTVATVAADKVDPANNGKLVTVAGEATTDETLTDGLFLVSAKALRLVRQVEMYQWKEEENGEEENPTYTYSKAWSSKPIDSQKFHDRRYRMPFLGKTLTPKVVKLGAFELPPELTAKIDKSEPLPASDEDASKATGKAESYTWKSVDGILYSGDPKNPKIGDLKVSFSVVKPQKVTVVGAQKGNTLAPYENTGGGSILVLKVGDQPTPAGAGISAKAIRLERKVEMFQYEEKSKTETRNKSVGGGQEQVTTYSYDKIWSNKSIDSQSFKKAEFKNPPMPFAGKTQTAKVVKLGAFELSPDLVAQIDKSEPLPATDADARTATGAARSYPWTSEGGVLYSGDPRNPKIGDLKVSFSVVKPLKVSVMAAQRNNTFAPFQPKSARHQINLLKVGDHTAQAMLTEQASLNTTMTWILRLVGFILMAVGIFLVLAPLSEFANIIPFLGGFVSSGISFLLGLFAFMVALVLSLITIAIAWLFYRPVLAVGLLAGAAVIGVGVFLLVRKMRKPAVRAG